MYAKWREVPHFEVNRIKGYISKAIITGRVIEIYDYHKPQYRLIGAVGGRGRAVEASEEGKMINRAITLTRAKRTVRRLININAGRYPERPKFLTLTFARDLYDIEEGNYEFERFVKRMNYHYDLKLEYVCVIEFQDENRGGVIHYHLVIFNMPYIDVNEIREKVWKQGFIKLNAIDHLHNLGSYLTKYMVKKSDDPRLKGKKCYFASRGLTTTFPETTDPEKIEELRNCGIAVFGAEYSNKFEGDVSYTILDKLVDNSEDVVDFSTVQRAIKWRSP